MSSDRKPVARVAKGKRPQYFSDPAIDKLHAMLMTVVAELSVTRERLDATLRLLDEKNLLSRGDVDAFVPDATAAAERQAERDAYIARIMRIVEMELEEIRSGEDRTSVDETMEMLLQDDD